MASIQDNKNSQFDPALIDRAWAQMHEQLDVAMPQRKRRRFAWWWPVFALVGTSLLAFWLWPSTERATDDAPRQVIEIPIADNDQHAPVSQPSNGQTLQPSNQQTNEPSNQFTPGEGNAQSASGNVQEPSNGQMVERSKQSFNQPSNRSTREPSNKVTLVEENFQSESGNIPQQSNRQTVERSNQPSNQPSKRSTPTDPARVDVEPRPIRHGQALNPLPNQPTNYLTTNPNPLTVEPSNRRTVNPWQYYVEGQAGVAFGINVREGVAIGGGVQRRISKKVKLEAGLNYQLERSFTLIGRDGSGDNFSNGEEFLDTVPGTSGSYDLTLRYAARNLVTQKASFFVGSHYQFKPRLAIGLGVQLGYFTRAYAVADDRFEAATLDPFVDADGDRLNLYAAEVSYYERDLSSNAVEGPYPLNIRRWQASVNTSVRYRFARYWETSLQYQAHLTSWPNEDRNFGGTSAVQVGLRYYLK